MLDSQEDEDVVGAVCRRWRSFDALPRDGSDTLLWFVEDSGAVCDYATETVGTSERRKAAGGGDGRCLSASDLLTAGDAQQGDDYDPSWCSVNNLETDCVSPRVSSNSLFSQLEAGTAESSDDVGDHPPSSSSYHLTAGESAPVTAGGRRTPSGFGDDQPMYTRYSRRIPSQTPTGSSQVPSQPITAFLLRQHGVGAPRPVPLGRRERRSSMAASTRSASCPSLVYDHRHATAVVLVPPQGPEDSVNGGEEHASRDQVRAVDKLAVAIDEALAPASIIAHTTGCGARAPMMWLTARPSRSASPPTSNPADHPVRDCAGVRRPTEDAGRKTRQRSVGSSSAMTTGRTTQRLARTKCLQWLNSFDEDD